MPAHADMLPALHELDRAVQSYDAMNSGLKLYVQLCQVGEWDRAERVRVDVIAHLEASMDATMRGHRKAKEIMKE